MSKTASKLNGQYIGKMIALHCFAGIGVAYCLKYLPDVYLPEKRMTARIGLVAIGVFLIVMWKIVLTRRKIIVDHKGTRVFGLFGARQIGFDEIAAIESRKFSMAISGVPVSDGYTYSELLLKKGRKLVISPEKFGNYDELIAAIKAGIENVPQTDRLVR